MNRTCVGCGNEFSTLNRNQRRCVRDCSRSTTSRHGARKNASNAHDVEFIGVDGEGVTLPDGTHRYVLLSVGDESLYHRDGSHLHWSEIFTFLYDEFEKNPRAVFVGFYLGYDFTQTLRTLPEERAKILFSPAGIAVRRRRTSGGNPVPFPVRAGAWEFDLLGMRRLKLRPAVSKVDFPKPWMYVCDTGGFWQCSFLKAIDPKGWPERPLTTPDEYATIVEGKANRATAEFEPKMIRYNVTENRVLAELMSRLNYGFVAAGLYLKKDQWFGPGQVASAWLKSIDAPTGEAVRAEVPPEFLDAARQTYYGGWFEIQAHGHIPGTTYEYDINSAYPDEIAKLPCLLHGTWTSGQGSRELNQYTMVHVEMWGKNRRTGVAPHRMENGSILRPQHSSGWMWATELYEAVNAGLISRFNVLEWVDYKPCDCPPPMRSIADLYTRRIAIGKNTVEGKALKLVYNSAYGKFAQSVGNPRFSNAVYASLITSGCRTRILSAIGSHPTGSESLVMVATDGVYFREPHPNLELDPNRLGAWDETRKQNLTLLMPGVYWDDEARERIRNGAAPQFKARGISAMDLAQRIGHLDEQFADFNGESWPTLRLEVGFNMQSCRQALHRGDWSLAGTVATGSHREISSAPAHKRVASSVARDGDIWRTRPWTRADRVESTPYDETFGAPLWEPLVGITPDADDIERPWYWALHGED